MSLTLVKIVSKVTGEVIEGENLTDRLIEYANRNRELFHLFFTGDTLITPEPDPAPPSVDYPTYSATALQQMTKADIVALLSAKSIESSESMPKSDLIAMVLEAQERGL
jgi:phosphotransacetylase